MTEQKTMPTRIGATEQMSLAQRMWKDPVWSKVISAGILTAISTIVGIVWAHVSGITFATVQAYLSVSVFAPVNTQRWAIVALALFMIAIGWVSGRASCRSADAPKIVHAPANPSLPQEIQPQQAYKSDNFFGFRWRWSVDPAGEIWGTKMYCPKCDHELLRTAINEYAYRQYTSSCENCGYSAKLDSDSLKHLYEKVKLAAERKIRTGEWKQTTKYTKSPQH